MLEGLEELREQDAFINAWSAIDAGIDKLKKYAREVRRTRVPAYTLATRM